MKFFLEFLFKKTIRMIINFNTSFCNFLITFFYASSFTALVMAVVMYIFDR